MSDKQVHLFYEFMTSAFQYAGLESSTDTLCDVSVAMTDDELKEYLDFYKNHKRWQEFFRSKKQYLRTVI